MLFSVSHSVVGKVPVIHLQHKTGITASIIPSAGAMLHSLQATTGGKNINLVDSYSTELAEESTGDWFKGVKLSPWPCRIPGGEYKFNGKSYKLEKLFRDGTALHGLLFDQKFKLMNEHADDLSASVQLVHNYIGNDPGYPFPFRCEVIFTLTASHSLEVKTIITNTGDRNCPIADGWHPYFQLGGVVDDWELQFPAQYMLEFNDQLVPTGKELPVQSFRTPELIGKRELDNCFLLENVKEKPACILRNPDNGIAISFFAEENYPYLQLFIPPYRTSIAIENLSAAPNAFNNGMGLKILDPNESVSFKVCYQITLQ